MPKKRRRRIIHKLTVPYGAKAKGAWRMRGNELYKGVERQRAKRELREWI